MIMEKVMVIGCCGAGKSTFSRKLHQITQLPLIHLDMEYWLPEWVETDKPEWESKVTEMAARASWIIDGNYGGTIDIRIRQADTIIMLDYPTWKCLWRITKRIVRHYGKARPDMPKGCNERFDAEFYHYVYNFNKKKRPGIMAKLEAIKEEKEVVFLRSDLEVDAFLNGLEKDK